MHYPISTAAFIAEIQADYGPDTTAEKIYRDIIPIINDAYHSGRTGLSDWPQNPAEEIAMCEAAGGTLTAGAKRIITAAIEWANTAYAQGQWDAGRVTV